jgi:hypothetical protein
LWIKSRENHGRNAPEIGGMAVKHGKQGGWAAWGS